MPVPSGPPPPSNRDDFEIAILCALSFEAEAVGALFDHTWEALKFGKKRGDQNTYRTGVIGEHNVVLVFLPGMGKSNAASAASSCATTFPSIRLALVVGICGGVPFPKSRKEILLGDVIISKGLVQHDFGRQLPGKFSRKATNQDDLAKPNREILSYLASLKEGTGYDRLANRTSDYLKDLLQKPRLNAKYPGAENDKLFEATYRHKHHGSSCAVCAQCEGKLDDVCQTSLDLTCDKLQCNDNRLVTRNRLADCRKDVPKPEVHFGYFASGDTVMKSGEARDELAASEKEEVMGFEMEGAGVWDNFHGCVVVIKAVCDYADSHKNKRWQNYAAAVAAAVSKAFLLDWAVTEKPTPRLQLGEINRASGDSNNAKLPFSGSAASAANAPNKPWLHGPQCMPGTQLELIQEILTWGENPNGAPMFWLNGMVGTGKSTIARTVSHHFADQNRLGASLFLSRGHVELGNATSFFITLATQLAEKFPAIQTSIRKAVSENFDISLQSANKQWQSLIFQPLLNLESSSSQSSPRTFVVVVDGLDECDNEEDIQLILQLLAEAKSLEAIRLRFFVTSGPDFFSFLDIPEIERHDCIFWDISEPVMRYNISLYLKHELGVVAKKTTSINSWLSDRNLELLCQESKWLFIHASTACRFISDPDRDPNEGFQLLKEDYMSQSPTRNLEQIYRHILARSILLRDTNLQRREKLTEEFGPIIGSIITLFEPLSAATLSGLLVVPVETMFPVLRSLYSVLDVPDSHDRPIRLLHHSFREFLLDQQKRIDLDDRLWIDEKWAHESLARSCLLLLSKSLKRDLCDLRLPGAPAQGLAKRRVEESLPRHVQYACRYWIDHVNQSDIDLSDDSDVYEFLRRHFLHWLEALSLMGCISVTLVRSLEVFKSKTPLKNDSQLFSIIQDARSFVLCNGSIIEKAPLQVYASGLLFAPESSTIRRLFSDQGPREIQNVLAGGEDWSLLRLLESRTARVTSMAFSLDMGQLASASSDGTIRFWDTEEGNLQWTVQEHSGYNNSIAFSPNGRRLASASSNFTVGLWDIEGRMLQATLERHSDIVNSVVFSPTGQLLASASDDRIVCIWNTGSRSLQKELVGHTEGVISVAFSPDGLRLVSASRDCTVRIWTIKGSSQRTLLSGSTEINSLAFSSDGCLLATASRGRIIRIWDASTGTLHREFKYHTVGIKSEISLNKGQQSSHRDSARIRAATIATSTESAHLNSGFRRTKGRSASSRQYQAPAQSSSQTPHHLTPAARASLPQRANTKSYPGLDRQVSDPWHPSRNNGTSRQYEVAAPIAYSTPLQGPHRGPHQGSYRGQQRGSQTSSRALDNYTTNVHQNATAIQGDPISWRSSPSGGRPWHHPRRSMPEPLSKEYGWGPRNSQSTSSLSRDNSNGGARSTHIGSSASKTPREYSDSHIEIHKLSFSNDGTHLITDIGIMKLEDSTSGTIPWPSYALDVEGSWITYKSEKVLLLPAEYRPTCQDFRDGAIALGSSSGRVTILRVDRVLQDVPIQDLGQMGRFGKQNSEWFPSENEGTLAEKDFEYSSTTKLIKTGPSPRIINRQTGITRSSWIANSQNSPVTPAFSPYALDRQTPQPIILTEEASINELPGSDPFQLIKPSDNPPHTDEQLSNQKTKPLSILDTIEQVVLSMMMPSQSENCSRSWEISQDNQLRTPRHLARPSTGLATASSLDQPKYEASFLVHWDVRNFLARQFRDFKSASLGSIITISGSSLHAQAATCEDYLVQNWPLTGKILLMVLQRAIDNVQSKHQEENQGGVKLEIKIEQKVLVCNVRGSSEEIIEVAQELAWLGAALQHSPTSDLTYSQARIQQVASISSKLVFDLHFDTGPPEKDIQACWHKLFSSAVVAEGFSIPKRGEEVGLEIPLRMIAGLTGIRHAVALERGLILKGHSCALVPVSRHKDSIQWHYLEDDIDRRFPYSEVEARFPNRAGLQDVNLEILHHVRAFVGWWGTTETHLGTEAADYSNLDYSSAEDVSRAVKFESVSLGFQNIITGEANFSLGARDGKFHVERKGPYQTVLRCASKTPVLLYDYDDKRAWLVPSSAVILHIARTRHIREPYTNGGRPINFPHANPQNSSHSSAEKTLLENSSLKLSGAEDSQDYYLRDVVRDIWSRLESILDINVNKEKSSELEVRVSMKYFLRGWEFMALVEDLSPLREKETAIQKCSGGWTRLVKDIDAVVLFASGFGDIIKPSEAACARGLCKRWGRVPKGKDYMAASIPTLVQLFDRAGSRLTQRYLTSSHLRWNRGQVLWEPCDSRSRQCNCDRLQGIVQKSTETFFTITEPGLLENNGAVIFGQTTQPLSLHKSAPKSHQLYSQQNVGFLREGSSDGSWSSDFQQLSVQSPISTSQPESTRRYGFAYDMLVQESFPNGSKESDERSKQLPLLKRSRDEEGIELPAQVPHYYQRRRLNRPANPESLTQASSTVTLSDLGQQTSFPSRPTINTTSCADVRLHHRGNVTKHDNAMDNIVYSKKDLDTAILVARDETGCTGD